MPAGMDGRDGTTVRQCGRWTDLEASWGTEEKTKKKVGDFSARLFASLLSSSPSLVLSFFSLISFGISPVVNRALSAELNVYHAQSHGTARQTRLTIRRDVRALSGSVPVCRQVRQRKCRVRSAVKRDASRHPALPCASVEQSFVTTRHRVVIGRLCARVGAGDRTLTVRTTYPESRLGRCARLRRDSVQCLSVEKGQIRRQKQVATFGVPVSQVSLSQLRFDRLVSHRHRKSPLRARSTHACEPPRDPLIRSRSGATIAHSSGCLIDRIPSSPSSLASFVLDTAQILL